MQTKAKTREMNKKQKFSLWLGILVFCLMGIYPPWCHSLDYRNRLYFEAPGGYSLIFRPPVYRFFDVNINQETSVPPPTPEFEIDHISILKRSTETHIDLTRLIIQWLCVISITLGFIITLKNQK